MLAESVRLTNWWQLGFIQRCGQTTRSASISHFHHTQSVHLVLLIQRSGQDQTRYRQKREGEWLPTKNLLCLCLMIMVSRRGIGYHQGLTHSTMLHLPHLCYARCFLVALSPVTVTSATLPDEAATMEEVQNYSYRKFTIYSNRLFVGLNQPPCRLLHTSHATPRGSGA